MDGMVSMMNDGECDCPICSANYLLKFYRVRDPESGKIVGCFFPGMPRTDDIANRGYVEEVIYPIKETHGGKEPA